MTKCSKNLTRHLTLLKQECNQIVTLHNNGYKVPLQILKDYNELAESGKTPLFFACEDVLLGMIAVADVVKADSAKAMKQLEAMGIPYEENPTDSGLTAFIHGGKEGRTTSC